MRNLEIEQMALVEGGNSCSNLANGANAAASILWSLGALTVATGFGLVLWGLSAVVLGASYVACEME